MATSASDASSPVSKKKKRESVSLKTFKKWYFSSDFKPDVDEDGNLIKLTCIVCSSHYPEIRKEAKLRRIKGCVLDGLVKYVDGIDIIHKGNVEKHVRSGSLHDWAKKTFCSQSSSEPSGIESQTEESQTEQTLTAKTPQPLVEFCNLKSQTNYVHLFNTAYDLVMSERPFTDFPMLIQMQRRNGVMFLTGKDDRFSCATFVHYLAEAVKDDIKNILSSVNFMCGEMDGSEARKTKEEKELVYCRVVIRGQPAEFLLQCQQMSKFGGVDANGTKAAFDAAFLDSYMVPTERFENLLIAVCADGASINMGRHVGACTQLKSTRPWLVIMHCVNHRLELAIADAFKANSAFKLLDDMMVKIYYLFRNSGKNKRILMRIALQLAVTCLSFRKVTGTRFQAHHYNALKTMIVNFLPLLLFAENMIEGAHGVCKPDLKAQLKGYHNQWVTYGYLGSLELYRQVLRLTTHVSLMFQRQSALITDVIDSLDECKTGLESVAATTQPEFPFSIEVTDDDDEATFTVKATNLPATSQFKERAQMTERQQKEADRCIDSQTIREKFTLKKVQEGKRKVLKVRTELVPSIVSCISKRFGSLHEPVLMAMRIADHTTWDCESPDFGKQDVITLSHHFSAPLIMHKFNLEFALKELNGVKKLKATKFKGFQGKLSFWNAIFCNEFQKFPHFLLIIEICLTLTFSSSTVERGFSTVKRHLPDTRLRLTNSSLNDLLLVRVNAPVLKKLDPNYEVKLVKKAVEMYQHDPHLSRGRYNKTSTTSAAHSEDFGSVKSTDTPDMFLPLPSCTGDKTSTSPLLDSDTEIILTSDSCCSQSESESDSESQI